uniref:Uncharacterized protein n=1 Tax=Aegilops tauschii subsp. strangulata TaxID=200361 RepID=A0A453PGQ4_AEGTS
RGGSGRRGRRWRRRGGPRSRRRRGGSPPPSRLTGRPSRRLVVRDAGPLGGQRSLFLLARRRDGRSAVDGGGEGEQRLYGARCETRRPAVWVTGATAEGDGWSARRQDERLSRVLLPGVGGSLASTILI